MSFADINKQIRDRDRNAESQSIEDIIQDAINRRTGLPRHVRDLAESFGVDAADAGRDITTFANNAWEIAEEHGIDPAQFQEWAMERLHRETIAPHTNDRSIESAARAMFGVSQSRRAGRARGYRRHVGRQEPFDTERDPRCSEPGQRACRPERQRQRQQRRECRRRRSVRDGRSHDQVGNLSTAISGRTDRTMATEKPSLDMAALAAAITAGIAALQPAKDVP